VTVGINAVIAGLTLRQAMARRRWLLVTLVASVPVIVAILARIYRPAQEDPIEFVGEVFPALLATVIVPLIALMLASAGFSAEIEDGTVVYLLSKPISRVQIVLMKLLVTSALCAAFSAGSTIVAGLVLMRAFDPTHFIIGFAVAAALGSLLYTALFLALGLVTRRGLLIGLTYLIVWEGALSGAFAGTRALSVRQYMLSVADAISTVDPAVFTALLPTSRAYWMSSIVAVGVTLLCIYRLRNFEVGETG
jgi:ABC-2 type transport system permease protein